LKESEKTTIVGLIFLLLTIETADEKEMKEMEVFFGRAEVRDG
jgi:hypothetical protein